MFFLTALLNTFIKRNQAAELFEISICLQPQALYNHASIPVQRNLAIPRKSIWKFN